MHRLRNLLFILVVMTSFATTAYGQCKPFVTDYSQVISNKYKKAVIDKVAQSLLENYVLLDESEAVIAYIIEQFDKGAYDAFKKTDTFTKKLTSDLHSFTGASHFAIVLKAHGGSGFFDSGPCGTGQDAVPTLRKLNYGFRSVEILDGNIGYIEMTNFADAALGGQAAMAAMNFVSNTDALIFDVRNSVGGYESMEQLLASHLMEPFTELHRVYDRYGKEVYVAQTFPVESNENLRTIPVYVLVNKNTRSAAEALPYDLKHRGRATVVGEVSAGAGFCAIIDSYDLDVFDLEIMLPSEKSVHPVTKGNYEGTGVKPDIEVSSDQALSAALNDIKAKHGINSDMAQGCSSQASSGPACGK